MTTITPTDNVQAKFDSAPVGDTINLVGVTINSTVVIRKPVTITGSAQTAPKVYAFEPAANGITITGLKLDGNLLRSTSNFRPDRLVISGNTIKCRRGTAGPANQNDGGVIDWGGGGAPTNCKITNNVFDPIESWTAIYMYGGRNIEIAYNEFRNRDDSGHSEGRCIKGFGQGGGVNPSPFPEGANNTGLTCGGVWVHHNLFSRIRGMAIEMQDGWLGNIYEDNYYELPLTVGTDWMNNRNVWAFSIVEARSVGMKCRRNLLDCRLPPGVPLGCFRVAIEGGGRDQEISDNYIIGNGPNRTADTGNSSIACNSSNGSGSASNNRIVNMGAPYNSNGSTVAMSGNTPTTALTWDISRPRPSAGTVTPPPPLPETAPEVSRDEFDALAKRVELLDKATVRTLATFDAIRAAIPD